MKKRSNRIVLVLLIASIMLNIFFGIRIEYTNNHVIFQINMKDLPEGTTEVYVYGDGTSAIFSGQKLTEN